MSKKTLKEVKEHFKNAKMVRCLHDRYTYTIDIKTIREGKFSFFCYDIYTSEDVQLFNKETNEYAEIIEYKEEVNNINVEAEEIEPKQVDLEKFFESVVHNTLEDIKKTLIIKGKEYRRNNNPFHNFEEGARIKNTTREKVLDGFLLKHEISINDITNDIEKGALPTIDAVNEKFNDNLIYLILKKASILDRIKKQSKN